MYSAVENVNDFQILCDGSIENDAIGHFQNLKDITYKL